MGRMINTAVAVTLVAGCASHEGGSQIQTVLIDANKTASEQPFEKSDNWAPDFQAVFSHEVSASMLTDSDAGLESSGLKCDFAEAESHRMALGSLAMVVVGGKSITLENGKPISITDDTANSLGKVIFDGLSSEASVGGVSNYEAKAIKTSDGSYIELDNQTFMTHPGGTEVQYSELRYMTPSDKPGVDFQTIDVNFTISMSNPNNPDNFHYVMRLGKGACIKSEHL